MLTKQNVALQIIVHSYILPQHPLLAQQTMTHGTSFKFIAKIIIKNERKDKGSTFTSPFTQLIGLQKEDRNHLSPEKKGVAQYKILQMHDPIRKFKRIPQ